MSTVDSLVRAAIKVVTIHRSMKRAHEDGASEPARMKYRKSMVQALDALDGAVEAFARAEKPPKPDGPPRAPFDWNGATRAALEVFKLVTKARGAKSAREVVEFIDAEVVK